MFYYILIKQIHNNQSLDDYNYEYEVHYLNVCINDH